MIVCEPGLEHNAWMIRSEGKCGVTSRRSCGASPLDRRCGRWWSSVVQVLAATILSSSQLVAVARCGCGCKVWLRLLRVVRMHHMMVMMVTVMMVDDGCGCFCVLLLVVVASASCVSGCQSYDLATDDTIGPGIIRILQGMTPHPPHTPQNHTHHKTTHTSCLSLLVWCVCDFAGLVCGLVCM